MDFVQKYRADFSRPGRGSAGPYLRTPAFCDKIREGKASKRRKQSMETCFWFLMLCFYLLRREPASRKSRRRLRLCRSERKARGLGSSAASRKSRRRLRHCRSEGERADCAVAPRAAKAEGVCGFAGAKGKRAGWAAAPRAAKAEGVCGFAGAKGERAGWAATPRAKGILGGIGQK